MGRWDNDWETAALPCLAARALSDRQCTQVVYFRSWRAKGPPPACPPSVAKDGRAETFQNPVLYEDYPDNAISVGTDGAF